MHNYPANIIHTPFSAGYLIPLSVTVLMISSMVSFIVFDNDTLRPDNVPSANLFIMSVATL